MKKKLSLLMAVLMASSVILSACGGSSSSSAAAGSDSSASAGSSVSTAGGQTPAASGEQKIIFALHNEPDSIDPGITDNTFAIPILFNAFEGLVAYDTENNIVAADAETWEISEDGLTYTFHLRDNLKWSDGTPLTAQDYLYSIKRVITPATGAKYAYMVTDYIKGAAEYYDLLGSGTADEAAIAEAEANLGVTAPDDQTLVITLNNTTPYFLGILAMWTYAPVQQATVEANGDSWTQSPDTFICNGPFKVSAMSFGEGVTLVKNENYWDAANVQLEEVEYRYILDMSTALSAFESGEIDGMMSVPSADLPRLKAESDSLTIWPAFGTTYYLLNNAVEPLDDPLVRQALNLAIDRTALIDSVMQSTDTPALALVGPGYVVDGEDFTEGRSDFGLSASGNVEEAQRLLAEAGYPNGEGFPTLRLGYYTDTVVKKVAEAMQQMFKQNLNIDLEITTADWAVYYEQVQAGDYDIAAMGWGADYLHPMSFLPLFETGSTQNYSNYSNPEYDALVEQARVEPDAQTAMDLMRQAEALMMEDYPFIPVFYRSYPMMMQTYVKGWSRSPLNYFYLKDAYVEVGA
ncbi:MAG TPA: peptide ABC transporter substrate-binding protein [Firmicutes bacterium]|nr:peptide ABC transporter substrate-binding protein [Bacillota bacterium]